MDRKKSAVLLVLVLCLCMFHVGCEVAEESELSAISV